MDKTDLKNYIKELVAELLSDDEDIEEITTSAAVPGYSTPFAFSKSEKDKKKRLKKIKKSTGYTAVNEELDKKDLQIITKLIKDVVGDIYRDIWLKRNAWK